MWGEDRNYNYKNRNYNDYEIDEDYSRGGDNAKNYNKTKFTSRKLVAWQVPEDVMFDKKISERFDPFEVGDNQNIKIDFYRQPSKEAARDPRDYRSLPQISKEFKPAMLEASTSEWIRGEPARHVLAEQISEKLGIKSDLNLYAVLEETFQLTENDVININLHSGRGNEGLCASVLFTSGYKAWELVRQSSRMAAWTMRIDSEAREFERIKLKDRESEKLRVRDESLRYDRRDDKINGIRDDRHQHRDIDRHEHWDTDRDTHRRDETRTQSQSQILHEHRKHMTCSLFVPCLRIPFSCDDSLPFRLTTEIIASIFPSTSFPSFSGVEKGSSTWHIHFGREIDIVAADEMLQRDLFHWKGEEFYFEKWNLMKGEQSWIIPEHYKKKKEFEQATRAMDVDVGYAEPSIPMPHHDLSEGDYLNLPRFTKKRTLTVDDSESDHSQGQDQDVSKSTGIKVKRKPIGKRIFVPPPMPLAPISAILSTTEPNVMMSSTSTLDVEIDEVPLKSGAARTEGFFALEPFEKQRVRFKGFLEAFSSNNSSTTINNGDSLTTTTESRSSRAQNRRPLPAATMIDLFKVSPLQSTQKLVALRNSSIHSYGLVVMEAADPGDLILEYVGELVRASVANIREWKYEREYKGDGIASSYLFRLDGIMVIDATYQGSLARFINHSCDPNCVAKTISLNGSKRIVMYAKKSIRPGDEITYDYKFPTEKDATKKVKCLCGTSSCRKFLN